MLQQLFTLDGLGIVFRLRVVLCVLGLIVYILSPWDIMSEAAFGFVGLIDDLCIALLLFIYATVAFRQVMASRQNA
jgi:RING finger protein 170